MPQLPVAVSGLAALDRRLDQEEPRELLARGLDSGRSIQRTSTGYTTAVRVAEPRDRREVFRRAKLDAELLGAGAWYSIPFKKRGGGTSRVEGPTVALAYSLLGAWGNAVAGAELVDQEADGSVWFLARFVDLETGITIERTYRGHCSPAPGSFRGEGRARWESMQYDAQQSRAVRGVILRGLPAWLVAGAVEAARSAVSADQLGGLSIAQARALLVDKGAELGLEPARLAAFVGSPLEAWTQSECVELVAAIRAVRDGEAERDVLFPIEEPRSGSAVSKTNALGLPSSVSSPPPVAPVSVAPKEATEEEASPPKKRKRAADGLSDLPFGDDS